MEKVAYSTLSTDTDLKACQDSMRRLIWQRTVWEQVLLENLPLLKGSVVQQYKQCGKKNCNCRDGARHGPFTYLSFSDGGKTRTVFVRKDLRGKVEGLVENYRLYRRARAQVVKLNQEILQLVNRIENLRTVAGKEVLS